MYLRTYLYIIIGVVTLASCSTTKYVGDDSFLLNKVDVKADGKYPDVNPSQLKSYVRQKGNSRWFVALDKPYSNVDG